MSKKELIIKAKAKLNSSRTKQEVFDELVAEFNEKPITIANFLKLTPTRAIKDKYRFFQIAALVLVLTLVLTQVLHYQAGHYPNVTTLWIVLRVVLVLIIITGITSYDARMFLAIAILAFVHGFRLITTLGLEYLTNLYLVDIAVCILLVIVGLFLRIKLETKYKEELIDEQGEEGITRKVSKIIFEEIKANKNDILD